jgi:hypothetical protein
MSPDIAKCPKTGKVTPSPIRMIKTRETGEGSPKLVFHSWREMKQKDIYHVSLLSTTIQQCGQELKHMHCTAQGKPRKLT